MTGNIYAVADQAVRLQLSLQHCKLQHWEPYILGVPVDVLRQRCSIVSPSHVIAIHIS